MNVKQIINPKDTLGVVWLYLLGSVFWLAVSGIAAMNLRTYLTYDLNSPQVGVIYYTLLTLHGWAGIFGFVNMAPAAIIAFSMYKSKLSIVHTKQMTILFWLANIFLALALIGGQIWIGTNTHLKQLRIRQLLRLSLFTVLHYLWAWDTSSWY